MIHLTNTHTLVAIKSQIAIPTILYCPKKVINSCIIMVKIIKIKTNICQIIIFLKYFSRRITLEIKQNMGKYIRIHFIYIIKKNEFFFWAFMSIIDMKHQWRCYDGNGNRSSSITRRNRNGTSSSYIGTCCIDDYLSMESI